MVERNLENEWSIAHEIATGIVSEIRKTGAEHVTVSIEWLARILAPVFVHRGIIFDEGTEADRRAFGRILRQVGELLSQTKEEMDPREGVVVRIEEFLPAARLTLPSRRRLH
jgi:hypothetical protein